MTAPTWTGRWVWPAGGSGGIPGDVVGSLVWAVIAGIVLAMVWPPLRHRIESFVHRIVGGHHAELHRKLDHIIRHHPTIPSLEEETA